jgi:GGDEF domain-containing protein
VRMTSRPRVGGDHDLAARVGGDHDLAARVGGDEFLLAWPGDDATDAAHEADDLRVRFRESEVELGNGAPVGGFTLRTRITMTVGAF